MRHYRNNHFVCDHPGCLEENFSVFGDRIELMHHKQQVHRQRVIVDVWFSLKISYQFSLLFFSLSKSQSFFKIISF